MRAMTFLFRLLFLCSLALTAPLAAAGGDTTARLAFSDDFTAKVVRSLEGGINQCQALASEYRFDCYRQNYRRTGALMNGKPDYRGAQKALRHVEAVLRSILRTNRDTAAPPLKVSGRTYKAVKPAAVKAAAAAFANARAEAVTMLLRSDGVARLHYARIARVVGSNKLIIRAALRVMRGLA